MWLFLVLALPLGLAHAIFAWFPATELSGNKRVIIRGLIASIPVWFLSRLLGSLLPPFPGSPLFALNEWLDRILPYSLLPLLGYAFFWPLKERVEADQLQRRMTVFYGACLGPFGFAEMTRELLAPDFYGLFVLPLILVLTTFAMPALYRLWLVAWTSRRVLLGIGFAAAGLLLGLARWLLLARYWYLALLVLAGALLLAWFKALPGLSKPGPKKVSLA